MNKLKLTLCLAITALALFPNTLAVKVNYYHPTIDQEACQSKIDSIPEEYFEGIKLIRVYYLPGKLANGCYLWGTGVIQLYNGCKRTTLIHELAHHKNFMDGIDLWHSGLHLQKFKEAEEEIKEKVIKPKVSMPPTTHSIENNLLIQLTQRDRMFL